MSTPPMESIFDLAIFVAIASWLFAVLESIGMWRFWEWVYRLGPAVVNEVVVLPESSLDSELPNDLVSVRMKLSPSQEILFRAPFKFFSFRFNTPLPMKGVLTLSKNESRFVARLPVGGLVFMGAWLLGWTVGGIGMEQDPSRNNAIIFVGVGWLFLAAMIVISLLVELRRIRTAKDQLIMHLTPGRGITHQVARPDRA